MGALEPQSEGPESFVLGVLVLFPFSLAFALLLAVIAPATACFLTNVLLADGATQPLHHTSDEGKHLAAGARYETDGVFESCKRPMLIEQDKHLE